MLTVDLLQGVVNVLADVNRKLALGIDNESGFYWEQGSYMYYYCSGTADENLPEDVGKSESSIYRGSLV